MRASLAGLVAVSLLPLPVLAQDRITVLETPGQAITVVAEPAAADRVPVLGRILEPHAARVGRWAGARHPATIFLMADRSRIPDLPGPLGELPGGQLDLERSAVYLWAGLVPQVGQPPPAALTRALSTFLVHTALRQLVGARPGALPVWLVAGLLDDASLSPPAPISPQAFAAAPFLELLHPAFNEPFLELLDTYPALGAAVSRALVDDLMTRAAPARLRGLLQALRTEDFEVVFERVYGRSLEAYQAEMARALGSRRGL